MRQGKRLDCFRGQTERGTELGLLEPRGLGSSPSSFTHWSELGKSLPSLSLGFLIRTLGVMR